MRLFRITERDTDFKSTNVAIVAAKTHGDALNLVTEAKPDAILEVKPVLLNPAWTSEWDATALLKWAIGKLCRPAILFLWKEGKWEGVFSTKGSDLEDRVGVMRMLSEQTGAEASPARRRSSKAAPGDEESGDDA